METLVLLLAVVINNVLSFEYSDDPDSKQCEIGDVVQNGRITCTCSSDAIYDCTYKKQPWLQNNKLSFKRKACQPQKIYVADTTTCICSHDGTWPHRACFDVFNALPASEVVKTRCKPGDYVFVGCNVCRCGTDGRIDKNRCTQNECHKTYRRSDKGSSVYGNCESKNWYSLAPCQFCFCLNENKLVCNTGNHLSQKLELGTYNLNVCGKDLIREAIELIPDDEKTLRQGESTPSSVQKTSSIKTTPSPAQEDTDRAESNIEFQVDVDDYNNDDSNGNRKDESSSSPESSFEDHRALAEEDEENTVQSTQIPYQENYQLNKKDTKDTVKLNEDEDDGNNYNYIVDTGLKIQQSPSDTVENYDIPVETIENTVYKEPGNQVTLKKDLEELGEQLQENIPMMLDHVFGMALRKSMVTIDQNSQCVPGAVKTVECNTCFCLKNSKLLCTNKKCEKK